MPTYEFKCPQGHSFDKFFRTIGGAATELPCPECGETAARQISGGAGLQFKGSGFYLTDYGKNAHRSSGDAKPAKTSESKATEAKPAESKPSDSKPSGGTSSGASKSGGDSAA